MTASFVMNIPSPPRGVWEIGPIPIRAYALCIIIGIIVAAFWGNRRLVARGGRPGAVTDLAVWAIPFGLVGGRIYHLITDPELYFAPGKNPWDAFAIWNGGLGIWGAIALGGLGTYIAARRYRIAFGAVADALAPPIVLAQAIGRVGNYFNQELFGAPTGVPWALNVYLRTPNGLPDPSVTCGPPFNGEFPTEWIKATPEVLCGTYHPTFLYELIWDVGVALLVVWADRRFRLGHGRAFALYVAGYTAGRGWIEMLRIDHANHILGLRLNVFVAAAVFVAAVIYLIATRHLGREDPADVRGIVPGKAGRSGGETPGGGGGAGRSGASADAAAAQADQSARTEPDEASGTAPDDAGGAPEDEAAESENPPGAENDVIGDDSPPADGTPQPADTRRQRPEPD